MKKKNRAKPAVSEKKTAKGLLYRQAYHNLAGKKKALNNGLFHKFPVRRKKHSINVFYQNRLEASRQSFYGEAGRKVKQFSPQSFSVALRLHPRSGGGLADVFVSKADRNKGVTGHRKVFAKKLWYYDKRAPIPGGNVKLSTGFMRKNKFYKKIFASYVVFKKYLGFNKKAMNKLYRNTAALQHPAVSSPFNNRLLMHMDSLFNSTMCKNGLKLNPNQNNIKQSYTLNGKAVRKKNFVLKHGNKAFLKDRDFCL